jgi:nucleotide-binding universal stress UspA family protein
LNVAKRLADQFDASITLVHVLDPIHAPGRYDSAKLRPLRAEALRDARQKLADLANDHDDLPHEVISGVIHTAIVKFAKKIDADLIVMSSHGRSGVKRLLAGSATENVVRTARCPVLVVP